MSFNPYHVLGLHIGCTEKEIQKAYKVLCLKWHPDKNPDRVEEANRRFIEAKKAVDILLDKEKRDEYEHQAKRKANQEAKQKERREKADGDRKRFMDDLERREKEFAERGKHYTPSHSAKESDERYKAKLRKEHEMQARAEAESLRKKWEAEVEAEIRAQDERIKSHAPQPHHEQNDPAPKLKAAWKVKENMDYDETALRILFAEYGHIDEILVLPEKKGKRSALIVFQEGVNAWGAETETGAGDCEISCKWIQKPAASEKKDTSSQEETEEAAEARKHNEFAEMSLDDMESMMMSSFMSTPDRINRKYGIKPDEKMLAEGSIVNTPEHALPPTSPEAGAYSMDDEAGMRAGISGTAIGSFNPCAKKPPAMSIVSNSLRSFFRSGSLASWMKKEQSAKFLTSFNPQQIDTDVVRSVIDFDRIPAHGASLPGGAPGTIPAQVRFFAGQDSFESGADVEIIGLATTQHIGGDPEVTTTRPSLLPMGPSSLDTVIPIGGSLSEAMAESQCVPLPAVKKNIYHGSREYFASHRPVALRTSTPTPSLKSICSLDGEVFFDQLAKPELPPLRVLDQVPEEEPTPGQPESSHLETLETRSEEPEDIGPTVPAVAAVDEEGKETDALLETYGAAVGRRNRRFRTLCVVPPPSYREQLAFGDSRLAMPTKTTLGRPEPIDIVPGPTERPPAVPSLGDRILLNVKSGIIDNRQNKIRTKRKMGEGVFGRLCLRKMKKQSELPANLRQQIANTSDERPFFTYWITTVQVIICLLSVLFYGFGPVGFSRVERKELVMHTSVTLKMVSMYEPANFWLGPSHANLIRLGAKYSPCMRLEPSIWKLIEKDRRDENQTGCCIYDDGSGCFQTTEENCPSYGARFHSWSTRPPRRRPSKPQVLPLFDATYTGEKAVVEALFSGNSKYTVGPVCGQDPGMCKTPPSSPPTEWKNDLSQWPICESVYKVSAYPDHMKCKLTGRPCCLMQLGQCRIATREYCAFVQGTYHENATLCSQVHCMEDVCGMVPFLIKDRPDQASRLFISLFLHAG
ncbi:unnamed protein product, partial [Mesorhabditis spiculigera]